MSSPLSAVARRLSFPSVPSAAAAAPRRLPAPPTDAFLPARRPPLLSLVAEAPAPAADLPSWYPATYDLQATVEGLRSVLEGQGTPRASVEPGAVQRLLFTDGDGTLLASRDPIYLRDKTTGRLVTYPGTKRVVMLPGATSRDTEAGMEALAKEYPDVKWRDFAPDYSAYGSVADLLRTPVIRPMLDRLAQASKDDQSRTFIVTARSDDSIVTGLQQYLSDRGSRLDGSVLVNSPNHIATMHLKDAPFTAAQRKAVSMAAAIRAYGPEHVKEVTFHDDGDDNLAAAMELLPALYPQIAFTFFDSISEGDYRFHAKQVGRSNRDGDIVAMDWGHGVERDTVLSDDQVAAYKSLEDLPVPLDPQLTEPNPSW